MSHAAGSLSSISLCLVIELQYLWCPLLQSGRLHGLHAVLRAQSAIAAHPLLSSVPGRLAMSPTSCTAQGIIIHSVSRAPCVPAKSQTCKRLPWPNVGPLSGQLIGNEHPTQLAKTTVMLKSTRSRPQRIQQSGNASLHVARASDWHGQLCQCLSQQHGRLEPDPHPLS